jgi:hypothetical protein
VGGDSTFVGSLEADGTPRWVVGLAGFEGHATVAPSGNVFAMGGAGFGLTSFAGQPISGSPQMLLGSLDATGAYRWAKGFSLSGLGGFSAGVIAPLGTSQVVVVGGIGGTIDFGCGATTSTSGEDVYVNAFAQ